MTADQDIVQEDLSEVAETAKELVEHPDIIKEYLENALPGLLSFLMQLVFSIVILIVGIRLIKFIIRIFRKSLEKGNVETGVVSFLCSLIKYVLYFVLIMIILGQFGVTTGSVVAVLGSAGLTIGLALQGSLANFAGGVLILLLKPFVVGNYIIDNDSGQEGTVAEISVFYTKLSTIDNKVILIPNGKLSNSSITNVSAMETRRLDLSVGVSYDSDLSKVKDILQQLAESDEACLPEQPVQVFVDQLADSCIQMGLHFWVKNENYWTAKWRIMEAVKTEFDKNGISIPFPQMDVQVSMQPSDVPSLRI